MLLAIATTTIVALSTIAVYLSPEYSWSASIRDSDGDGYADEDDAFENDPTEWLDTDGDETGDNSDAFPEDPDEWCDSDEDGCGDNSDEFPDDPSETADSDDAGVGDNEDEFPDDPSETSDTDDDGVGDNEDEFPEDPEEFEDTDNDGVGDNSDEFPDDPDEWVDSDGDGVGDNSDDFPDDPTQWTAITPSLLLTKTAIIDGFRLTFIISDQIPWNDLMVRLSDGTNTATWSEILSEELDDGVAAMSGPYPALLGAISANLTALDVAGNGEVDTGDYITLTSDGFSSALTYTVEFIYELTDEVMGTAYFTG